MAATPETGFLVIADITGYTAYLSRSELEHVGVDADPASIEAARRHASEAKVSDRVSFELGDAAGLGSGETFDLVIIFEVCTT